MKKRINLWKMPAISSYQGLLLLFLFAQPVLDIYRIFVDDAVELFGFSIPELINMAMIAWIAILFVIRYLHNRKVMIFLSVYGTALVAYLVAHCWNILQFDGSIITGSEINVVRELYFILRVYLIPMIYFFCLMTEKMDGSIFEKGTKILAGFISGVVVLSNVLGIGFITYASTLEINDFISRTIFDWFTNPDIYYPSHMSCKGWFYTGNQISMILFMLFPFVLRSAFKSQTPGNYGLVLLQTVAMLMVGTKVASLGAVLIIAASVVIYFIFALAKKRPVINKKAVTALVCAVLLVAVLFPFSPVIAIQIEREEAGDTSVEYAEQGKDALADILEEVEDSDPGDTEEEAEWSEEAIRKFVNNLNQYHNSYGISKAFIDMFSVENNVYFWRDVVMDEEQTQLDYREFKQVIYQEVLRKNDNPADRWLGIGYTSNFIYAEKDGLGQVIWFGYVGTLLLLGPYLACVAYIIFRVLKKIKVAFCYENAFFAISLLGSLLLSLMAGHLFYGVFSIIVFVWLLAGTYHFQFALEE